MDQNPSPWVWHCASQLSGIPNSPASFSRAIPSQDTRPGVQTSWSSLPIRVWAWVSGMYFGLFLDPSLQVLDLGFQGGLLPQEVGRDYRCDLDLDTRQAFTPGGQFV